MVNDIAISVSRVTWSPDGNFVGVCLLDRLLTFSLHMFVLIAFLAAGVAFSKHLVHLYAYPVSNDLIQRLEVS